MKDLVKLVNEILNVGTMSAEYNQKIYSLRVAINNLRCDLKPTTTDAHKEAIELFAKQSEDMLNTLENMQIRPHELKAYVSKL